MHTWGEEEILYLGCHSNFWDWLCEIKISTQCCYQNSGLWNVLFSAWRPQKATDLCRGDRRCTLDCSVQSRIWSPSIYPDAVVWSIWSGDVTSQEPAGLTYPLTFFLALLLILSAVKRSIHSLPFAFTSITRSSQKFGLRDYLSLLLGDSWVSERIFSVII